MNAESWAKGYTQLCVAFPDREMTPEHAAARGRVYREHLDDLAEGQWLHAVDAAIRGQKFFPTVSELRDYGSSWEPKLPALGAGDCGACDGTGWEHHVRDGYSYVRPCTCRAPRLAG